jgi:hypothetical protein
MARCMSCGALLGEDAAAGLEDGDSISALCRACWEESEAELHDAGCSCAGCERLQERWQSEQRQREARTYGGLSALGHQLLGAGWWEE